MRSKADVAAVLPHRSRGSFLRPRILAARIEHALDVTARLVGERLLLLALFGHVSRPDQCPVSGCRGADRSEPDPGCVKTRNSRECVELYAQLPTSDRCYQYNWYSHLDALIAVKNQKSADADRLLLPQRYWHGPRLTLTGQF
jgi:hypothetical protein